MKIHTALLPGRRCPVRLAGLAVFTAALLCLTFSSAQAELPVAATAPDSRKEIVPFAAYSSVQSTTVPAAQQAAPPTPPAVTPDWNGVWRDTGTIAGLQFAAVGITYMLPESFSNWTPEQKKAGLAKYKRNFVNPVFDKDDFYVNYILHPYWGATYYIRGRERGLDSTSSFMFSALLSAMYEFGTECIAEKPSIQDLIVTPVGGALLGAYVFEPLRNLIKSKEELRWYDHIALVTTDPLGLLSLGVEKLFGIKSTVTVDLMAPHKQDTSVQTANTEYGRHIGITWQFPLD